MQLRYELGIEHSLQEIGIDDQLANLIASMAIEDPSAQSNPILFNDREYRNILLSAIRGDTMQLSKAAMVRLEESP